MTGRAYPCLRLGRQHRLHFRDLGGTSDRVTMRFGARPLYPILPGLDSNQQPFVNSRMLCQLSYRGTAAKL